MNDDMSKLKVLEMLSNGQITTEEAMRLLEQLNDTPHVDPRQVNPNKRHNRGEEEHDYEEDEDEDDHYEPVGLFDQIKESLEDVIGTDFSEITDSIKEGMEDIDIADIFSASHRGSFTYNSPPIAQNISALRLLGKNDKVEIVGHGGNQIRITCVYRSKRPDTNISVSQAGGVFEVLYDYNAMRSMKIYCELPRVFVEEINAESKNAALYMCGVNAGNINMVTKNAKIKAEHITAHEVDAKTCNASIEVEGVKAGSLNLQTSNSKISVDETQADTARLVTSNAKVVTEDVNITHLYIKTSNSSIKMEDIFGRRNGIARQNNIEEQERTIEAHTTNGGVAVYVPRHMAAWVQASTSHSRVECRLPNMLMGESTGNYINSKSYNYESTPCRVKINISTTNAAIKIREA